MMITNAAPRAYKKGELLYWNFLRGGVSGSGGWTHYQGPLPFQTPGGRLFLVWGAYDTKETNNDNAAYYAVSDDRGITWSTAKVFHSEPGANVSHHYFLNHKASKRILLFWRETYFRGDNDDSKMVASTQDYAKSHSRICMRESTDEMKSWSHVRQLDIVGEATKGAFFYGAPHPPLELASGRIILPITYLTKADPQTMTARFLFSDDSGNTWKCGPSDVEVDAPRGAMEPNVVEIAPRELLCLFRTKAGCRYRARSVDGGENWSHPEPTSIMTPESISALVKLHSGALLLVRNPGSAKINWPRYPLSATLSDDGGESWGEDILIKEESDRNQLSNFGLLQLDDGRLVLSISHYHATPPTTSDVDIAVFDEAWLRSQ